MRTHMATVLEPVLIRGIEGFVADGYLMKVLEGDSALRWLEDYQEAKYIAVQVYMQWRGLGLK